MDVRFRVHFSVLKADIWRCITHTLNLNPIEWRSFLTAISGFVFFDLIADIFLDLCSLTLCITSLLISLNSFQRIYSPSPYRYLYTVRALCVYTHTHVPYISVLVVVDYALLHLLTMMMYTHPVSSTLLISCLLPLPPVYYEGVA